MILGGVAPASISILVPCYNERDTLAVIVKRIADADTLGLRKEIIIVDDGSTDGSADVVRNLMANPALPLRGLFHEQNRGKGAAIRTAVQAASGDLVLIQDADLEYDPSDYPRLIRPIFENRADVVFGSRFRGGEASRVLFFWHSVANRCLTLLSNMFTDLNLTDMETGFKLFRRSVIAPIRINEDRFGFEPEITAKIARVKPAPVIYEVGISYRGRTYAEGKKIGIKDAIRALYCILRYNMWPV